MPSDPIVRRVRALLGQGLTGLVPAAPASPSGKYLDATGAWSVPAGGGGGVTVHSNLSGLRWSGSGHTDTAYSIPWFGAGGAAATLGVGGAAQFLGVSGLTPTWSTPNHPDVGTLGWTASGHTAGATSVAGFAGTAAATYPVGATGLALLDDATPAAARTTMELGTAAVCSASAARAASGLLLLDSVGWFGMDAALAAWRYSTSVAHFANNTTSGYGFTVSQAGTGATPSTLAYSRREATLNSGWFVSPRLASLTIGFAFALIFKLPSSITSRRLWIGLGSTTMNDSDTAAGSFVGVRYSTVAGDAGFMPASRNGTTQTIGTAGSAPVADVPYMMTIQAATGGSSVAVKITRLDTGATVLDVTISATLPASGTAIDWLLYNHGQGTLRAVEIAQAVRLMGLT